MPKPEQVACPKCGRRQPKQAAGSIYWCAPCRGQFDDDPDEGGDFSDRNAAARLEREERRAEQLRQGRVR